MATAFDFGELLIDNSAGALIAKTPAGRVKYWNKGAAGADCYTRERAAGRLLDDIIAPSGRTGRKKP